MPYLFWAPTIENKDAVDPIFTEPIESLSDTNDYVNELDTLFGFNSQVLKLKLQNIFFIHFYKFLGNDIFHRPGICR